MLDEWAKKKKWQLQTDYKNVVREPLAHRFSQTAEGYQAIVDFLSWLDKVEKVVPVLKIRSEEKRWRERFKYPAEQLKEQITPGYLNPEVVQLEVNQELGHLWQQLMEEMLEHRKLIEKIEKEIHERNVEEESLAQGEEAVRLGLAGIKLSQQSVDLTREGIEYTKEDVSLTKKAVWFSKWMPVIVLIAGVVASIVAGAFKKEIDHAVRSIFPSTREKAEPAVERHMGIAGNP